MLSEIREDRSGIDAGDDRGPKSGTLIPKVVICA